MIGSIQIIRFGCCLFNNLKSKMKTKLLLIIVVLMILTIPMIAVNQATYIRRSSNSFVYWSYSKHELGEVDEATRLRLRKYREYLNRTAAMPYTLGFGWQVHSEGEYYYYLHDREKIRSLDEIAPPRKIKKSELMKISDAQDIIQKHL